MLALANLLPATTNGPKVCFFENRIAAKCRRKPELFASEPGVEE